MKLVHEFDSSSWQTMHRLVAIRDDGTRVEGEFSLYESFAILSDARLQGFEEESEPLSGWMVVTDYFKDVHPRLSRFSLADSTSLEEADVKVVAASFQKTLDAECAEVEKEITNAAHLCPCFQCKDKRAQGEDDGNEPGEQHFVLPA